MYAADFFSSAYIFFFFAPLVLIFDSVSVEIYIMYSFHLVQQKKVYQKKGASSDSLAKLDK